MLVDLVLEVDSTGRRSAAATQQRPFRRALAALTQFFTPGSTTATLGPVLDTPTGIWEFLATSKAIKSTVGLDQLPKVALLFLTRGPLPFEATWSLFLSGMQLPQLGALTWRDFYNIHVHAPPGFSYPEDSIFAGALIEERVVVEWGQFSVAQAELNLISAGLKDPRAQRFVLLSEACIPLYTAPVLWAQLLSQPLSRINACHNTSDPGDTSRIMAYRWHRGMETAALKQHHWRKSAQWIALTRPHAQAVHEDEHVKPRFKEHCWIDVENWRKGWQVRSFCVADEHYIPTLLAMKGLDNETDCTGAVTHAWWDGPYSHPRTHGSQDVGDDLLRTVRGNNEDPNRCPVDSTTASVRQVFGGPLPLQQDSNSVAATGLQEAAGQTPFIASHISLDPSASAAEADASQGNTTTELSASGRSQASFVG
ncbi:hypothetical protein WJX73_006397 [Symbiochloris irregularis]|uniref:Glycosyltransferase n=1 Tax=Symbiochloris irregularis TaxID=706552 RepID=A0AAW1NQL1_9CHLO